MKYVFTTAFIMVFMLSSFAQVNVGEFAERFMRDEPKERILIQTNQQLYKQGDSICVRCHLVDEMTHMPSTSPSYPKDRSKFVYLELHNCQSDTLVHRYKLKADSMGVFSNAIAIPDSITEGYYMLVAYTRWMMNFNERDFGYKEIYVVGNQKETAVNTPSPQQELSVQVYPEGGGLLPQHLQNITYMITDSQHYPQAAEIRLVNSERDSIIVCSHTEYEGIGQISFIPEYGSHYYIEAHTANGTYGRQKICEPKTAGAQLQVKRRKTLIAVDIIKYNYEADKLRLLACNNGIFSSIAISGSSVVLSNESFQKGKVTFILIDTSNHSVLSTRTIYVSGQ